MEQTRYQDIHAQKLLLVAYRQLRGCGDRFAGIATHLPKRLFGCIARWVSFGLDAGSWRRIQKSSKFRIKSSSINRSQVELMLLQYGGLDVRTRQGMASRDEAGCSGRSPAAVPIGKVGWLVLKSTALVPGLGYPACGPCVRTDITRLIVCSIPFEQIGCSTGPAMLGGLTRLVRRAGSRTDRES